MLFMVLFVGLIFAISIWGSKETAKIKTESMVWNAHLNRKDVV